MPAHEFTVAELRATIAAELDHAAGFQAATLRAVMVMLDDYTAAARPDQGAETADGRALARLAKAAAARRAWKEYEKDLPQLVTAAATAGMSAPNIARELGAGESYVYRILRGHAHYSWRLDLYDSEAGPGWQQWEAGDDVVPLSPGHEIEFELAVRILNEAGRGPRKHPARVLIWKGTEDQPDEAAVYTHEQQPTD